MSRHGPAKSPSLQQHVVPAYFLTFYWEGRQGIWNSPFLITVSKTRGSLQNRHLECLISLPPRRYGAGNTVSHGLVTTFKWWELPKAGAFMVLHGSSRDLLACYVILCDHGFLVFIYLFFLLSSVREERGKGIFLWCFSNKSKSCVSARWLWPISLARFCSGQHHSYPYLSNKEVEPQRLIK